MPIRTRTILSTKAVGGLGVWALLLFAGSAANAQNALGDGNALDANPGQYGSSNYARPSLVDELRFRNSIATGNAPGGLSFRGDLGYRSAGEFTGELGSDSLFAFRRDSLYSGLAGMGIRGTDALQYQFALTTGSAPPPHARAAHAPPTFALAPCYHRLDPAPRVLGNSYAYRLP